MRDLTLLIGKHGGPMDVRMRMALLNLLVLGFPLAVLAMMLFCVVLNVELIQAKCHVVRPY